MKKEYRTLHYLIKLFKEYGIKYIISSPGMQNSYFNAIVQQNNFFNVYSVVDERSAGYIASGMIYETQKPVIITCTGATASRNYISAMTECYYRKMPLIVVTFYNNTSTKYSLSPQYIDRSQSQNDIKHDSINLVEINSQNDLTNNLLAINNGLYRAIYQKEVIHFNCPSGYPCKKFEYDLPNEIWFTKSYEDDFAKLKEELYNKIFALFIGAHDKFSETETKAISDFAISWNIPVFCDHTSNYNGANKILVSKAFFQIRLKKKPHIIIDIGSISGEYTNFALFKNTNIWRISPDKQFKARNSQPCLKIFNCSEIKFFKDMKNLNFNRGSYYNDIIKNISTIKIPDLPLSTTLICKNLAKYLPKNSSLHCAILNSLRNLNFFDLDKTIDVNCNVGGFGIDGAISTIVGQSFINQNKKIFGIVGDLAFFYDMNVLGLRNIKNNIRIIIINNNCGMEFRLNQQIENALKENTNILIAAGNHYTNGAKDWAISCGFHYMSTKKKDDLENKINEFCNNNFEKPVIFEIFTKIEDEQKAINLIQNFNKNKLEENLIKAFKVMIN